MYTGRVAEWGLKSGQALICLENYDWDFNIGSVYYLSDCDMFDLVISHSSNPYTSTISTNSKFILLSKLSELLFIGD